MKLLTRDDKDTLLLFDSRVDVLSQLVEILRPIYHVRVALTALKAHELCVLEPAPTLVFVGLSLADSEGLEFCERIRAEPAIADMPIICFSDSADALLEEKAFALGAADFVAQPFNANILLSRVYNQVTLAYRDVELQKKIEQRTEELVQSKKILIHRLSCAAEYRDDETYTHIARMSRYCHIIAKAYGANEAWCERIYQAAPLHDIGKIGMPDSVLNKQGELSEDERQLMQRHTLIGAEILGDDDEPLMVMARSIALGHHERYDGSGYPFGLKGDAIALAARIVAIADTFDALQAPRPYRQAMTVEQASVFINDNSNTLFDPILVEVFNHAMPQILRVRSQFADEIL